MFTRGFARDLFIGTLGVLVIAGGSACLTDKKLIVSQPETVNGEQLALAANLATLDISSTVQNDSIIFTTATKTKDSQIDPVPQIDRIFGEDSVLEMCVPTVPKWTHKDNIVDIYFNTFTITPQDAGYERNLYRVIVKNIDGYEVQRKYIVIFKNPDEKIDKNRILLFESLEKYNEYFLNQSREL